MNRELILHITAVFSDNSETNYLSPPANTAEELEALENRFHAGNFSKHNMPQGGDYTSLNKGKTEEYVGMRFFEAPILSIGAADNPLFWDLKKPQAVGEHFMVPQEWLPGAKSVITLFLPFTDRVISSNQKDKVQPSMEWLFTRVDGQQHLLATAGLVKEALEREGYQAVVPQLDDRYIMRTSLLQTNLPIPAFSSNWSERHVAYVTGLGTFGRHTNFISKRGCCGRLISIITDWETKPDEKDYSGIYDYCTECGACYRACPAAALSGEGKSIKACSTFLHENSKQYAPRYGCGKCQSGLPCSKGVPKRR
ncbi:MAG: 4Fe-4S binding protein [Oscillospiraceae bacterium]|nr:4Fe-4S binding protein [Oscillospiraceae bacterium]